MFSVHNKGKFWNFVVAEKLIRTLESKTYEYLWKLMTSVSKNVYIDNLDNVVNKYNDTYHSTTKMKDFRIEKVINKKVMNYMLNGKDTIIRLIAG